ncbi:MAG: CotH kinase family protein [Sphingobacteriales bacterium]|nr:CotH kinase family protein [Sphingobacteriales bacterium]
MLPCSISRAIALFAALFATTMAQAQVVINEFSAANVSIVDDNYGEYEDVIELYNTAATATDLTGWYMSDRTSEPTKWQFPAGTSIAANGFLRIWASGKNELSGGNIHTNFKITQTRNVEAIVLADPSGTPVDINEIDIPNKRNHSWGRTTNGAASWGVMTTPTIGANNANVKLPYALKPEIDPPGGGYTSSVTVTLSTDEPNSIIRYTTDGTAPTGTSPVYSAPITLTSTTVVRAVTYSNDTQIPSSFIESNTYFIDVSHSVKILSVYSGGVFDLLDGDNDIEPEGGFEMYSPTFERLDESYGQYNKHGNDSWAYDQRGFDYIVQDEYGYDYAVHDAVFPNTDRDEYQRLIIKAAANDNYPFEEGAHIRDAYLHVLSQRANLALDERSYEPCVVYLNGEYWGLYELREKVDDDDYTDYYYDKDGEDIDFIKTWGWAWTEYGDQAQWNDLYDFIVGNDMTDAGNYAYVESKFNLLSLIDYIIINTQSVCTDWLNYNTGWWHSNDDEVKWRYILWDLDATFGHYINYTGVPDDSPTANPCDNQSPDISDPEGHTEMLTALLQNETFRENYLNRYADLNNTYFTCEYMIGLLDSMIMRIEPEMAGQTARWGGTVADWQDKVQELRDFILTRCVAIDQGIADCYDVVPYNIVIKVEPPLSGTAIINNIANTNDTWTGLYYSDITLDMAAIPNAGYLFDRWEIANGTPPTDIYAENIVLDITATDTIIAHFTPPLSLVILADPDAGGTISVNGTTVSLPYVSTDPIGTNFVLTATPNTGFEFVDWTSQVHTLNPSPNDATVLFSLQDSDTITAHFVVPQISLTVEVSPSNGGTVSVNGTTPSAFPYTTDFAYNSSINAIATPEMGFAFSHWELANHPIPDPNSPNLDFNITQADVLRAVFEPIELQLTLDAEPAAGGTIVFNGNAISSFPYTVSVTYNDLIDLTAAPNASYGFINWTVDAGAALASPTNPLQSFNIAQATELTANFAQNVVTVTITVTNAEGGTITVNGETVATSPYTIQVVEGTPINLGATPNEGYEFGGWTGVGAGINPDNLTITVNADGSLTIGVSFDEIIINAPEINCGPVQPTAFSPNNDGVNDDFKLLTPCAIREYSLRVFDRWGRQVFTSNDPAIGWNGRLEGRDCEIGVYVWVADYELEDNGTWEAHNDKGNVTIVR